MCLKLGRGSQTGKHMLAYHIDRFSSNRNDISLTAQHITIPDSQLLQAQTGIANASVSSCYPANMVDHRHTLNAPS
jgi:hypothetical protein